MTTRLDSSASKRGKSIPSVRAVPRGGPIFLLNLRIMAAGTDGIIRKIRETVGDRPVYLSIDVSHVTFISMSADDFIVCKIDSIDPAFAPATGTPETGGWSTRELRTILRGLDGLHIVSADIVEVAPAYDTNAELTTMAAADVSICSKVSTPRLTAPARFCTRS